MFAVFFFRWSKFWSLRFHLDFWLSASWTCRLQVTFSLLRIASPAIVVNQIWKIAASFDCRMFLCCFAWTPLWINNSFPSMTLFAWIMVVVQLLVSSKLGRLIKNLSNLFLVAETSKFRKQNWKSLLHSFFFCCFGLHSTLDDQLPFLIQSCNEAACLVDDG